MSRKTLTMLAAAAVLGLLGTGCDRMGTPADDVHAEWHWVNPPQTFTLWAGQNIDAGTITVWGGPASLFVAFNATGEWWLSESHVAVATTLGGIPHNNNGVPTPGSFPYGAIYDPPVKCDTYEIPWDPGWQTGQELFVATHAMVVSLDDTGAVTKAQTGWAGDHGFPCRRWSLYFHWTVGWTYKDVTLPTFPVQMRGFYPGSMGSYWDIELAGIGDFPSGYDVWNGMWKGWCAEQLVYMYPNTWYTVTLWSTVDPNLPARCGTIDAWEHVNYLLNHKNPAAEVMDIESAIWYLMGTGDYPTDAEAVAMVEDALANGEDWRPQQGDFIAVILESPANIQLCFIEVDP